MGLVNEKSFLEKIKKCAQSNDLKEIETLQNEIIELKMPYLIYEFAKQVKGADISKLQDALISCYEHYKEDEWKYFFKFAKNIDGVNVEKLQNDFLEKTWWTCDLITEFAKQIKGANIDLLEDIVLDLQHNEQIIAIEDITYFAEQVKGANIEKLQNGFMLNLKEVLKDPNRNGCDPKDVIDLVVEFINKVKGADFDKIKNLIFEFDEPSFYPYYIYLFTLEFDLKDIENIEPIFINACNKKKDYSDVADFAINIKGANVKKLQELVIQNGTARDVTAFAATVEGADIDKLENAVIASGKPGDICNFAYEVDGANIGKLQDAIIKTGDAYHICEFAEDYADDDDLNKLYDAVVAIGDEQYIKKFEKLLDKKEKKVDDGATGDMQ